MYSLKAKKASSLQKKCLFQGYNCGEIGNVKTEGHFIWQLECPWGFSLSNVCE